MHLGTMDDARTPSPLPPPRTRACTHTCTRTRERTHTHNGAHTNAHTQVAVHLGMMDDARKLYIAAERYDLLNTLYQVRMDLHKIWVR